MSNQPARELFLSIEQQVVPFFKAWDSYLEEIGNVVVSYEERWQKYLTKKLPKGFGGDRPHPIIFPQWEKYFTSEKFISLVEVDKHFLIAIKPLLKKFFDSNPLIHEEMGDNEDIMIYKQHSGEWRRQLTGEWKRLPIQFKKWMQSNDGTRFLFSKEPLPPRIKINERLLESGKDILKVLKEFQIEQREYYREHNQGINLIYCLPIDARISGIVNAQGKSCKEAIKALIKREKTLIIKQNRIQEVSQDEPGKGDGFPKDVQPEDKNPVKVIADISTGQMWLGKEKRDLESLDIKLLKKLNEVYKATPGKVALKDDLIKDVWMDEDDPDSQPYDDQLYIRIGNLREAFKGLKIPCKIKTYHGRGYAIVSKKNIIFEIK